MGIYYYISADKDSVLVFIQKFAYEEDLGKVRIREESGSTTRLYAPATFGLRNVRYTWLCKDDPGNLSVEVRLCPPILKMLGFYTSFTLIALCLYISSLLLIIRGLYTVIQDGTLMFSLVVGIAGFLLFLPLRYSKTRRMILARERCFADRLRLSFQSGEQSPQPEILSLGVQICLLYLPCALLFAALIRVFPIPAILFVPFAAVPMIHSFAEKMAAQSPWAAWRAMLLDWVSRRAALCYVAFLGLALFNIFGALIFILQEGERGTSRDFLNTALEFAILDTTHQTTGPSILADNAEVLQQAMAKYQVGNYQPISDAKIFWGILVCLAVVAIMLAVVNLVDWIRAWCIARASPKLTFSPPPVLPGLGRTAPRHTFAILVMCLVLLLAAVGNIFHLLLTVEILSVVLFDRATLSYSVAQAVGWLAIDLEAAAEGNVCRSVFGAGLLIIFTLPTVATVLIWTSNFLGHTVRWFKCVLSAPVDQGLIRSVQEFCSAVGVRTPNLCIMERKELDLVTTMPWFFGRSSIFISRSVLENLTKDELKAAIAHELTHIKHDTGAIRLTRWLSLISLFPCNAFALLLDMENREMRADRIATKITGNSRAAAEALIKISVGQVFVPDIERIKVNSNITLWGRLQRYALLLRPLLWPESIMGYTHPSLRTRLTTLHKSNATLDKGYADGKQQDDESERAHERKSKVRRT